MAYRAAIINEESKINQAYEAIRMLLSNNLPISLYTDQLVSERKKIDDAYFVIDGLFAASYEAMRLWTNEDKIRRDSKLNVEFHTVARLAADVKRITEAELAAKIRAANELKLAAEVAANNARVIADNKAIMDRREFEAVAKLATEVKFAIEEELANKISAANELNLAAEVAANNARVIAANKEIMDRRDALIIDLNLQLAVVAQDRINDMITAHCDHCGLFFKE